MHLKYRFSIRGLGWYRFPSVLSEGGVAGFRTREKLDSIEVQNLPSAHPMRQS